MLTSILLVVTVLLILQVLTMFLCFILMRDFVVFSKQLNILHTLTQLGSSASIRADKVINEMYAHTKALDYQSFGPLPGNESLERNEPWTRDLYRSQDGKYQATSLPELLEKMKEDPDYFPKPEDPHAELDKLRDAFMDDADSWKYPKNKDDEKDKDDGSK